MWSAPLVHSHESLIAIEWSRADLPGSGLTQLGIKSGRRRDDRYRVVGNAVLVHKKLFGLASHQHSQPRLLGVDPSTAWCLRQDRAAIVGEALTANHHHGRGLQTARRDSTDVRDARWDLSMERLLLRVTWAEAPGANENDVAQDEQGPAVAEDLQRQVGRAPPTACPSAPH